jgi:hypothetical protein
MKKHVTQMTAKEKKFLIDRFKSIPRSKWHFFGYGKKRAVARQIDLQLYNSLWTEGFDLIEYHFHDEHRDNRILIRSIATDSNDAQLCISFSFNDKKVVTSYLNARTYKHNTLRWEEYTANLDVITLFKETKGGRTYVKI